MKRLFPVLLAILLIGVLTTLSAEEAEFRTIVSRHDKTVGGEFHVDLEIRLQDSVTPLTVASIECDVRYSQELAGWDGDPSLNWSLGPAQGYADSVIKYESSYRIVIDGSRVKSASGISSNLSGWKVTPSWQRLVTLRWTIVSDSSVSISLVGESLSATHYLAASKSPSGEILDFRISNNRIKAAVPVCRASFAASREHVNVGEPVIFTSYSDGAVSYTWDFGEGASRLGSPVESHIYTTPGTYYPSLIITCEDGSTSTDTDQIIVDAAPECTASFTVSVTQAEVGQNITFTSTSSGALAYVWDFGDGTTAQGNPITRSYTTAGTYSVSLTISCFDGSATSEPTQIEIVPGEACVASFTASSEWAEVGQVLTFTSSSTGNMSNDWDFGDGTTATGNPVAHAFASAGNYTVILSVTCLDGSTAEDRRLIIVTEPCAAVFTAAPNPIYLGQTVAFTSTSPGATSFSWNFGDGQSGTGNPATHIYSAAGTYQATLSITCTYGTHTSEPVAIVVDEIPACSPFFTITPETACVDVPLSFTANADAQSWTWDFGDGTTGTGREITHSYTHADNYVVTLTTLCAAGGSGVASKTLLVSSTLLADLTAQPLQGMLPLQVQFTDQSTGGVLSWAWDFGDGGQSTEQNPSHLYTTAGVFTIHLTVTNGCGANTVVKENLITVRAIPVKQYDYGNVALPSARHLYCPGTSIGTVITAENSSTDPSENDGMILGEMIPGRNSTMKVNVSQNGFIAAWIDFDGNTTDWAITPPTNVVTPQSISGGIETAYHFDIPASAMVSDQRWIRIRYSVGSVADVSLPMGAADNACGEVQDYLFTLTPVELSSFTAVNNHGVIRLEWRTQSETENLGFHLYRSESQNGAYQQITETLIPGAGTTATLHTYTFEDHNTTVNQTYYYKLVDVDYNGQLQMHGPIMVTATAPREYTLDQNYPNPFNPETRITFMLTESGYADLTVYNLNGQRVRTLTAKQLNAGTHSCTWDGRDHNGKIMPSGTYLYKLQVNGFELTRKMEFVK